MSCAQKIILTSLFFGIFFLNIHALAKDDVILNVKLDLGITAAKNGHLNEAGAVIFLKKAYEQGLLTQGSHKFPNPNCIKAQNIGEQGGSKTLALFTIAVSEKCIKENHPSQDDYKIVYILKEMQDRLEPHNLAIVKNHNDLNKLDMSRPKEKGLPSLSFHHELLSYKDNKGSEHIFSILHAAPGIEVRALSTQLSIYHRDKKSTQRSDYKEKLESLKKAYYNVGRALAKMQYKYMEPKEQIFGKTYAHGDFHERNVFVDGDLVTFIDNETFTHSLKEKQPVWVDMMRFLNPTYNPKPDRYHPQDMSAEEWRSLYVTPFFQGYVDGYPQDKRGKVKEELKKILLQNSEATEKIMGYGKENFEKVKKDYFAPALAEIR